MIRHRDDLPFWLVEHGFIGTGVEIGTYFGQYAEIILKSWPGHLVGVDPFINDFDGYVDGCNLVDLEEAMHCALKLLAPFGDRFRLMRKSSVEAVNEFEDGSLDFVFLDGNHSYGHVNADMHGYWPKIKSGGVMGLHDFYTRNDSYQKCDVPRAVIDFYREHDLNFHVTKCTSAWFVKP